MRRCKKVVASICAIVLVGACDSANEPSQYVGYIEVDWVYVAAPQSGWLVSSQVQQGDPVSADQVVFTLDQDLQSAHLDEAQAKAAQAKAQVADLSKGSRPAELNVLRAQLAQAQANFERAKSERDRVMPLVEKEVEAEIRGDQVMAEFDRTKAAVVAAKEALNVASLAGREDAIDAASSARASAQAAVRAAQWQLDQRTVKAPVDARVEDVFFLTGEYVTAGTPVLALFSRDNLRAQFFVPQADLPKLKVDQTLWVSADGAPNPTEAKIVFIADTPEFTPPVIYSVGSREKLVFKVEAKLVGEHNLHAGLPVDIKVRSNRE